jgi:hypothetical protein
MRRAASVSRRTLVLVALGVTCWVAPGIAAPATRGGHVTADEPQYLLTALSLAEDRNLDISDERGAGRYRAFHRANLPRQEAERSDGRAISPHDPLLPALLAPAMGLGGWVAAKATLAVLAGVLAALTLWTATTRFGVSSRVAVVTVLAFATSVPLAMYGTQVYPELPAALAVTAAMAVLAGPTSNRALVVLVAAVVALPWFAVKYVPVAAVLAGLGLARWLRRNGRAPVAAATAVLATAAAVFAVAHQAWYGGLTPYAAGSHFGAGELTVVGHEPDYAGRAIRLVGLLLDRDFGLAAWQPAFLLAIPAVGALVARRPPQWPVLAAPLAAGWLTATFVALTMHGWWIPGRQVVAVLPALVLVVAWWADQHGARARRAVAVLGVAGASVHAWLVAQAVFGDLTTVVTFESMTHPLWRAWRLLLPDYRDRGAADWLLHGVWLALLGGAAVLGARVGRPRRTCTRTSRVPTWR